MLAHISHDISVTVCFLFILSIRHIISLRIYLRPLFLRRGWCDIETPGDHAHEQPQASLALFVRCRFFYCELDIIIQQMQAYREKGKIIMHCEENGHNIKRWYWNNSWYVSQRVKFTHLLVTMFCLALYRREK